MVSSPTSDYRCNKSDSASVVTSSGNGIATTVESSPLMSVATQRVAEQGMDVIPEFGNKPEEEMTDLAP